jgi:hypothetical protein
MKYWVPFMTAMNAKSLYRQDAEAACPTSRLFPRELSVWKWFLMYVWENIKPRSRKDPAAKPSSAHQVLLSIRRMHKWRRLKHCCVALKYVAEEIRGMVIWFRDTYGPEALMPTRKDPIPYSVVHAILRISTGTVLDGTHTVDLSQFKWRSLLALVAVLKISGFRKAEVSLPNQDVKFGLQHLSRANIVWFKQNQINADLCSTCTTKALTEPTLEDIKSLRPGDIMGISPPPAKADQTGERYGPFMVYVKLTTEPTNAAFQVAQIELAWPAQCHSARKSLPLFGPCKGQAFTNSQLDALLPVFLRYVASTTSLISITDIKRFSWHSFRIALACALRSLTLSGGGKVPDSTIQAMVRWATPKSLELYARMSINDYSSLVEEAEKAAFDSHQAARLLQTLPPTDDDSKFIFNEALAKALELTSAADENLADNA